MLILFKNMRQDNSKVHTVQSLQDFGSFTRKRLISLGIEQEGYFLLGRLCWEGEASDVLYSPQASFCRGHKALFESAVELLTYNFPVFRLDYSERLSINQAEARLGEYMSRVKESVTDFKAGWESAPYDFHHFRSEAFCTMGLRFKGWERKQTDERKRVGLERAAILLAHAREVIDSAS